MKKQLTFIDISPFRGGAEISLENIIKEINKNYNIRLLIAKNNFNNLENVKIQYLNINEKYLRIRKDSFMSLCYLYIAFKESLKQKEYTIITNTFKAHILGFFMKILKRTKYWIILERDVPENKSIFLIKRLMYRYAYIKVFNSVFLRKNFVFETKNVYTIENIINRKSINIIKKTNPIFLFVGRRTYEKGFDRIIDMFKYIKERLNNSELRVYGEGKIKNEYNGIHYFGFIDNIDKIYECGDFILLFNRVKESFARVIAEAMLYGIIPVLLKGNGMDDYVKNNYNGLVFEEYNKKYIAHSIVELYNNKERMQLLKENAKKIINKYNKEIIIKKWETVFNRVR